MRQTNSLAPTPSSLSPVEKHSYAISLTVILLLAMACSGIAICFYNIFKNTKPENPSSETSPTTTDDINEPETSIPIRPIARPIAAWGSPRNSEERNANRRPAGGLQLPNSGELQLPNSIATSPISSSKGSPTTGDRPQSPTF